jgi:chromosome segregation ATPase
MKKNIFFYLCLATILFSCNNEGDKLKTQVQDQLSTIDNFITAEKSHEPDFEAAQTAINNMPDKFKQTQAETYAKLQEQLESVTSRRNMMAQGLEDLKAELAKLSALSAEEAKLTYENRLMPMMKKYTESMSRYDRNILELKARIDSLANAYK